MTTTKTAATPPEDKTTFEFTLAGKPCALTLTPTAMISISRAFGGLMPAMDRVRALDLDALAMIVNVGSGRPDKDLKRTATEVAQSDLAEVMGACIDLLARALNGAPKPLLAAKEAA